MLQQWQTDMIELVKLHQLNDMKYLSQDKKNVEFHFTDETGKTLLHYAVGQMTESLLPTIQFLLEKEIDPLAVDSSFVNAIELAKKNNNTPALAMMKHYVNVKNEGNKLLLNNE